MPFDETWFHYIRENPDKAWSWGAISNNPILAGSALPHKYPNYPWKWQSLVCQVSLGHEMFDVEEMAWDTVDPHDYETDWLSVSAHPRLPIAAVLEHPEYPWIWYYVSQNIQLTWDIVEDYAHLPWDWSGLSANPMTVWHSSYVEPELEMDDDIQMDTID